MKRNGICVVLVFSMLLSGCGFMNGSYVSVTPHQEQRQVAQPEVVSAETYLDLLDALKDMIWAGAESAIINVARFPAKAVEQGMEVAIRYAMENDPIGAYAVQDITYEIGYSGGQPAVAIQINYLHNRMEIRKIRHLDNMEQVQTAVAEALKEHLPSTVLLVREYVNLDFTQLVQSLASEEPHLVMETPQVFAGIYGNGSQRVVELKFTYQNGRGALRQMQAQVRPVFEAALLYVSADASQWQKYSQLYGFLMERFEYTLETSITPAYSLLHHGVGDSKAFATVYAAMCRGIGLECMVITGTRAGSPWSWNLVCDNGYYYHVDLLRCSEQGRFMEMTDGQMQGYVWDYSSYPGSTGPADPEAGHPENSGVGQPQQTVPDENQEMTLPVNPENNT